MILTLKDDADVQNALVGIQISHLLKFGKQDAPSSLQYYARS